MAANIAPKKFEIELRLAQNEPGQVLSYLHDFLSSINQSFSESNTVINPNPSVLKIISDKPITSQTIKFSIDSFKTEDLNNPSRGINYVNSRLYPDDIIEIIFKTRAWLTQKYPATAKDYSWKIEASTLENDLQKAITDKINKVGLNPAQNIANFSRGDLRDAVTELLTQIKVALGETPDQIEYDSIDELIDRIKKDFAQEPEKIWSKNCLALIKAFAETSPNATVIPSSDKKFKPSDIRLVINTIYKEVVEQIEKKDDQIKKPWDRASKDIKKFFDSKQAPYFVTNELQSKIISNKDKTKGETFIERIKQLLEELEKEPAAASPAAEETAADENGGGEDTTTDEKTTQLTLDEIIRSTLKKLQLESGEIFSQHFSLTTDPYNFSQQQLDWLVKELPAHIKTALNQDLAEIKTVIKQWATDQLTLEETTEADSSRYSINAEQLTALHQHIAIQLFTNHQSDFLKLIDSTPTQQQLDQKTEPVQPDTPEKTAIVPDTAEATTTDQEPTTSGLNIDQARATRDLTTQFLVAQFGNADDKTLYQLAFDLIRNQLPAKPTQADLDQLKNQIFNSLLLNSQFFEQAEKIYTQKLNQLGFDSSINIGRIQATIDSILALSQDPEKYFSNLTDVEFKDIFGLTNSNVDIKQFKALLRGLIAIRRFKAGGKITAWFTKEDEKAKIPQALSHVDTFIKHYGEDGLAAMSLTPEEVDQSQVISQHRKATIKQLYKNLWLASVADKSNAELMEIYNFYGVNVIEIDFNARPVPDGFTFADAAYQANLTGAAGQTEHSSAAKKLFSTGKQKLGKAALSAVAPELAPILTALENMPIIGTAVKDAEEKAGKLALILGAGAVATVGGLIKLLSQGSGAMMGGIVGGIIGGIAGFTIGGIGVGVGVGTAVGAWLGGGGYKTIGDWIKNLGSGGSFAQGTHLGPHAQYSLANVKHKAATKTLTTAKTSFKIAGGTVIGGTVIATITAAGTQLHPVKGIPDPGYNVPGSEISCSQDKAPLKNKIFELATGDIAVRGASIVSDLYQGFWCYWNRSPGDYPDDVTDYPDSYPELFNEERFATNPDESYESLSSCGDCLFWCTWLVLKAYSDTNTPITISLNSQGQADAFRKEKRYVEPEDATPDNIPPGSAVYFYVKGGPDRLNHTALVIDVDSDGITFVQSNASTKYGSITFKESGIGVTPTIPGATVGGFGIP